MIYSIKGHDRDMNFSNYKDSVLTLLVWLTTEEPPDLE